MYPTMVQHEKINSQAEQLNTHTHLSMNTWCAYKWIDKVNINQRVLLFSLNFIQITSICSVFGIIVLHLNTNACGSFSIWFKFNHHGLSEHEGLSVSLQINRCIFLKRDSFISSYIALDDYGSPFSRIRYTIN